MKIIVTGCRGQLGTEIIKQLREGRSELGPIPEKLVSATVIPVDLPELDITNYKMVDDFIRRQRPDVIINCAAFTNVDGCEVNHDTAFKANAIGPRNLAQAATATLANASFSEILSNASVISFFICLPPCPAKYTVQCRTVPAPSGSGGSYDL